MSFLSNNRERERLLQIKRRDDCFPISLNIGTYCARANYVVRLQKFRRADPSKDNTLYSIWKAIRNQFGFSDPHLIARVPATYYYVMNT